MKRKIRRRDLTGVYRALSRGFGPQRWWPAKTPLEVCVGAVLTQNASWQNVERAISNIRRAGALSLGRLTEMPEGELADLIRPSGYFRLKAKRLKHLLEFLSDGGGARWRLNLRRMPLDAARERLLGVHGVGPETADSILLYAADMPSFVVDKYTLRVGARCGWFPHGTKYEAARSWFVRTLPSDAGLYNEFHALMVRLGSQCCKTKPVCGECPINKSCDYGSKNRSR
ncbi:MAG: hypothetical protein HY098_03885 [Nitrospinae bacterium]|nr:hypothetical protein [Nitrospinota bacterium]